MKYLESFSEEKNANRNSLHKSRNKNIKHSFVSSNFWSIKDGKIKVYHFKLLKFLAKNGYAKIKLNKSNDYIFVREENNRLKISSEAEMIETVKCFLDNRQNNNVLEHFIAGVSSYINAKKLYFLPTVKEPKDRDEINSSTFYFSNCFVQIKEESITSYDYKSLDKKIWDNRIIKRKYDKPRTEEVGQFEKFCYNLSKKNEARFLAMKSFIGYLLHRNKENGEIRAIILYDENMGVDGQAHGGTGKTLLCQAIGECREVITFDGREFKKGSWFKNQRISLSTDIIFYDELQQSTGMQDFFSGLTTGIEVEKKRQSSFYINVQDAPKYVIATNYLVTGPGGSSDRRRRYEYEVANHYDDKYTPEKEFGNRFFGRHWDKNEWDKFYHFMMYCVQAYLINGLVNAEPLNIGDARILNKCRPEIYEYIETFIEYDKWIDKRLFQSNFEEIYPDFLDSSHSWKKCLTAFAIEKGAKLELKSTGGEYFFRMNEKGEQDEEV